MAIERNRKPQLSRKRKLSEEPVEHFSNKILNPDIIDQRQKDTDQVYTNLAKSYLKGKVVREAISKMNPAQWIPIEENDTNTAASARRLFEEESKNGTIITFNMFQQCVDSLLNQKKKISGSYFSGSIPGVLINQTDNVRAFSKSNKDKFNPLIEWLKDNGIAVSIIAAITLSPWFDQFYALSAEESGAKVYHTSKVIIGIVILLELGAKAQQILEVLKQSKIKTPEIENQVAEYAESSYKRASALKDFGIDAEEFREYVKSDDYKVVVNYTKDYYARYGGLDKPNGYLTIDHWLSYLQTAQLTEFVGQALNTSVHFSPKFREIYKNVNYITDEEFSSSIFSLSKKNKSTSNNKVSIPIAGGIGVMDSVAKKSSDFFDNIVDSLSYYLSDRALCCLVQIFGKVGNTDLMISIASICRILAMDFGIYLSLLFNIFTRFLADILQALLFKILTLLNMFYEKIASKITEWFSYDSERFSACVGMFTLGWVILHAVRVLFEKMKQIIKDIYTIIGEFGAGFGSRKDWSYSVERRYLIGVARILELMASKLSLANSCYNASKINKSRKDVTVPEIEFDNPALLEILKETEPIISISEENKKKFFSKSTPKKTENLRIDFGINIEQNNEDASASGCEQEKDNSAELDLIIKNLTNTLKQTFND